MPDLNLKLVLQALDRGATPTVQKFRVQLKGLTKDVKEAPAGWVQTKVAMDRTTTAQKRFNEAGRQGSRTLDDLIARQRRLRMETNQTESAWTRFSRRMGNSRLGGWLAGGGAARMAAGAGGLIGAGLVAGGTVAAAGAGSLTGKVIKTGAQFESYQATLKTLSGGDVDKAKGQMRWVQEFAKKTPYELDQVMEAFVRMRAYGIEPTDGSLKSLGNASSAMQKDIMAAVEMLADAQTGEFERLKEFGIRARQQGEKVTFTYSKAGKDITVTSKKTANEIRRTLLGIFDGQFAGAMDEQSRTWNGMVSNLKDSWSGFLLKIAEGGAFEVAKGHLKKLLDFISSEEGQKKIEEWAGKISDSLVDLLNTLAKLGTEVDWVQMAKDFSTLAKAVADLARALNWLGEQASVFDFSKEYKGGQGKDYLWEWTHPSKEKVAKSGADLAMLRNPWAESMARRRAAEPAPPRSTINPGNRPLPGLGGGPLVKPAPLKGKIDIGLAPGLTLQRSDFGFGIDTGLRRGPAG